MIPKKIHYCWFGGKPLPKEVKKCIKSWKKYCPDYEIVLWNEDNFNVKCNKFVQTAYEEKAWAFVSDYARLKIIYENGGIYLDTDVEILKNLDELLKNKNYFTIQQCDKNINTGLGFGAIKKSKVIKEMMQVYDNIVFNKANKENIICPILNTRILEKYGFKYSEKIEFLLDGEITIYPPKYFDPLAPGNTENLLCNETFSIHHYSASWEKKSIKIKRKISRLIGQDKINKIKKILKR